MYVSGGDISGSEEESVNNVLLRLISLSVHKKLNVTPVETFFYYGEAISLPFYDAIFITGIIHNSLIRQRAQHFCASFHSRMWKHTGIADATRR